MLVQALASSLFGLVFFGVLLFWPAGTFDYWQAWVFIAVFAAMSTGADRVLGVRKPDGAAAPHAGGPDRGDQTAAENHHRRHHRDGGRGAAWSARWTIGSVGRRCRRRSSVVGDVLVAVGLAMAMIVVNQNSYAAATITVEAEQTVVSTGLYGIVRHPMYFGALIMMVGMPLALDSYWGLVTRRPGGGGARLPDRRRGEDAAAANSPATTSTCSKVHYRLVPGVW